MRRLLLFDVLADDFDGCAAAASGEVGGRPQRSTPQLLADARVVLLRIMRLDMGNGSQAERPRTIWRDQSVVSDRSGDGATRGD